MFPLVSGSFHLVTWHTDLEISLQFVTRDPATTGPVIVYHSLSAQARVHSCQVDPITMNGIAVSSLGRHNLPREKNVHGPFLSCVVIKILMRHVQLDKSTKMPILLKCNFKRYS